MEAKYGGAVYTNGEPTRMTRVTMEQCTFTGNSARGMGGGVYISDSTELDMARCTFEQNTAFVEGGACASIVNP